MEATHEPDLRELETLGLLTPHPGPLPVEGRGSSSWSQCASKSWRSVLPMNRTLTRPCGHPLPSDPGYAGGFAEASGRGAGGEGSFSVEVHGPNARARLVQVFALHEPSPLVAADVRRQPLYRLRFEEPIEAVARRIGNRIGIGARDAGGVGTVSGGRVLEAESGTWPGEDETVAAAIDVEGRGDGRR